MKEGFPKKPPKEPKVEAPMLRDTKDPKQFAEEHGALVRDRIARRLRILQEDRAARLAAAGQEPKPEPAADPAVVPDASVGSSPDVIADPVNPDAGAPASQVDSDVDVSGLKTGRRRNKKQEPTPVTPAVQPTLAATVPPVVLTPSVGDPVADPALPPADVKIADAADTTGVPDGLLDPEDALKIQKAVDAQNAQQAAAATTNTVSDSSLNIADPVVIVQPRKRQVNRPDPAVAAAVAAGGSIPAGIYPNSLPVLNEPLPDDFDKKYNIEGMTLAPKEDVSKGLELVPKDGDPLPSTPEAIILPETLASGEAPKLETVEKSEVDELKTKVDLMRLQYVTTDYNQDSWWKKIKSKFGPKDLADRNDADTESAFQMYTHALTEYQNAQLTEMEKEGLTPEERSKRMAGMLKFLKADEFLEMKKARHQVKLEGMTKAEKVVEAFEKVGQWYNKLPKKAKFAVSAAVFAGVAGTAMVGSPTLLAAAGGLSLCKRLVATAGLAVSANNLIEGWQEGKMKNRAESDIEEDLSIILAKDKNVESDWETQKARFEMVLEKDRNTLDTRFGKLKNQDRLRRLGAWGGATALVFGASAASAAMGGGGSSTAGGAIRERLNGLRTPSSSAAPVVERVASAAAASSAPESASAAVRAASSVAGAASGVPGSSVAGEVLNAEAVSSADNAGTSTYDYNTGPRIPTGISEVPISERAASFLKEHVVTAADGKRGLWGILDNRLSDSIPKGPGRDRMIQSLENAMRAKLDAMSPAERVAAGFPKALENGKVNLDFIKSGDTISFSKLLTPQEIQSVLEGKSIATPGVTDAASASGKIVTGATQLIDTNSAEYRASIEAAHEQMIAQDRVEHGYTPAEQAALNRAEDEMIAAERAKENLELSKATKVGVFDAAKENFNLASLNTPQAFAKFYAEHRTEMHQTFVRIGSDVFRTPEVLSEARNHLDVSPYRYSQATLGKVQMSWVNQTLGEMRSGYTQFKYNSIRFPLHPSQMENLMRLTVAAQDPRMFGIAGRPLYNETVNDYMSRMSAYAVATGKEEKFIAFFQGRR